MYEVKKPLIPVSLKSVDNLKQDYKNILDWLQAKMIFLFYNPFLVILKPVLSSPDVFHSIKRTYIILKY